MQIRCYFSILCNKTCKTLCSLAVNNYFFSLLLLLLFILFRLDLFYFGESKGSFPYFAAWSQGDDYSSAFLWMPFGVRAIFGIFIRSLLLCPNFASLVNLRASSRPIMMSFDEYVCFWTCIRDLVESRSFYSWAMALVVAFFLWCGFAFYGCQTSYMRHQSVSSLWFSG